MKHDPRKSILLSTSSAFVLSMALSAPAQAESNPFSVAELPAGYMLAAAEGKCGEGKCGASKAKEMKCGEGKCGASKAKEMKCGEGKCGASKAKEMKCGEGKCGEAKQKSSSDRFTY